MKDNRLENMRREYESITIPVELKRRVEAGIKQGKADTIRDKQKRRFPVWAKLASGIAFAMVALVIVVNSNSQIAYAMSDIPLLGQLVKVVTLTPYEKECQDMKAKIEILKIEAEEKRLEQAAQKLNEEKKLEQTVQQLNADIKAYTDTVIQQFEADVVATNGEGYEEVTMDHEVVTDNEKLFSIRINTTIALNTSGITIKIYHIDKETGETITLPDICKENVDYKTILSDEIKTQMREQMKKDENCIYFLDDTDMPAFNWNGLGDEANFYFNEKGKLVFVFDKYEVAPGYMGVCEFEISDDVVASILKEEYR